MNYYTPITIRLVTRLIRSKLDKTKTGFSQHGIL